MRLAEMAVGTKVWARRLRPFAGRGQAHNREWESWEGEFCWRAL
jgi:hypothetical protein